MKRAALLWVSVIGFVGCGGGGSHKDASVVQPDAAVVDMEPDRPDFAGTFLPDAGPDGPPPDPAPWQYTDVGGGGVKGQVVVTNGLYSIRAAGTDIGGTADGFAFVYQKMKGDGEIIAKVRSLQMVDPMTRAGIMFRTDANDPASANVFLGIVADPTLGGQFQSRATKGGPTEVARMETGVRAAQWLRLTRAGKRFTAWRSTNRQSWALVGNVDVDLPEEVAVGLAVSSKSATTATTADFDAYRVHSFGTDAASRAWIFDEMATMGSSVLFADGKLRFSAMGEPLTPPNDAGAFLFKPITGNQTIIAKIESISGPAPLSRVGLMFREGTPLNLARTSVSAMISVTAGMGIQFQSRTMPTLGVTMQGMAEPDTKAPVWLKLEKADDPMTFTSTFTGSYSADGKQWTKLDSVSFLMQVPATAGILVDASSTAQLASTVLSNVSLQ